MIYKLPKHSLASVVYALMPILSERDEKATVIADNFMQLGQDEMGVPQTLYMLLAPLIDKIPDLTLSAIDDTCSIDLTTNIGEYPKNRHLIRSITERMSGSVLSQNIDFSKGWFQSVFKGVELPGVGLRKKSLFIGFTYGCDFNRFFLKHNGIQFNAILEERFGLFRYFVGTDAEYEKYHQTFLVRKMKHVPIDVDFLELLTGVALSTMVIGDSQSLVIAMAQAMGKKHIVIDEVDLSAVDASIPTQLHIKHSTSASEIMDFITTDLI